jgi:geranylgeranyl diphosphate synthase type I
MAMSSTDVTFFADQLKIRKQRSDRIIEEYWQDELLTIRKNYGDASFRTMQAYASILSRGGKRIRAALAESSYRMFGGADQQVVDDTGRILEMIHTYLLIIDDISDRSDLRRNGPSAHRLLEEWHNQEGLRGDRQHFGANMATLAAMTGLHQAITDTTKLSVPVTQRVAALENLNELLAITCHGQINDLVNEANGTHDESRVEKVLLWKTAYYSFVNPLQFGAILAKAPEEALDVLADYGRAAGRAFQLSDDILGLFGSADQTGKNPSDDIREGKRTLLVLKALERANQADVTFLESQLGNQSITDESLTRCQNILQQSGALQEVRQELDRSSQRAKHIIADGRLPIGEGVRFLTGLVEYLRTRKD